MKPKVKLNFRMHIVWSLKLGGSQIQCFMSLTTYYDYLIFFSIPPLLTLMKMNLSGAQGCSLPNFPVGAEMQPEFQITVSKNKDLFIDYENHQVLPLDILI
jgi:hypothetical protein